MLPFIYSILNPQRRHSSDGWNPANNKHCVWDQRDPSLRWNDGVWGYGGAEMKKLNNHSDVCKAAHLNQVYKRQPPAPSCQRRLASR
jgi:hypothetical protein